jgi:two-component system, LytTR family, response regulator
MPPLRVLIVDDEPLARAGLRAIVSAEPDVTVVGECANGTDAIERLSLGDTDVALIDVQMPDMDGFEVLAALPEDRRPVVVFVTAHDHFAIQAFEANAIDYVLKPFRDERIRATLARARKQVEQRLAGDARAVLSDLMTRLPTSADGGRLADRIAVRSVGKVSFVRVADILWVGAADYYTELHTRDGKTHLVRETMQRMEQRLDPSAFVRVHRTAIVRTDHVAELRATGVDRAVVVLRDGTRVPLSRSRREVLEARLGGL